MLRPAALALSLALCVPTLAFAGGEHRLIETSRTRAMHKQLNQAGADGFRLASFEVDTSSVGGNTVVAVVTRPNDRLAGCWEYRVVADWRPKELDQELQEAAALGFRVRDLSFSQHGTIANEFVLVLERESSDDRPPWQYTLLRSRTAKDMSRQLAKASAEGLQLVDVAAGSARGRREVLVIVGRSVAGETDSRG